MPPTPPLSSSSAARALIAVGAAALAFGSAAQSRTGDQVYEAVCARCHAQGVEKAPKTGDRKAWAPLIREGLAALTGIAWVGIRGMPARGGDHTLPLEDFARPTAHMARAAGATWADPDEALLQRIRVLEKRRLEQLRKARSAG
ncbi:c-type cytochrome [Azohydromonas sp.]|uniref:c-type cytochrome n=1 Tax=Azohydromonas sp. TaxID=1872666 RepID=UPI002C10C11A|nr:c-type cytochrome [Azohydromonas sp.]HMM85978.1 c-type cytochrome [Azohydromonas sp.]